MIIYVLTPERNYVDKTVDLSMIWRNIDKPMIKIAMSASGGLAMTDYFTGEPTHETVKCTRSYPIF